MRFQRAPLAPPSRFLDLRGLGPTRRNGPFINIKPRFASHLRYPGLLNDPQSSLTLARRARGARSFQYHKETSPNTPHPHPVKRKQRGGLP